MKIALVGYGKMGAALLKCWTKSEASTHQFTVIDPTISLDQPPGGSEDRLTFLDAPPDEAARFDLVIAAVKPQAMDDILPQYGALLAEGGFVASIAAGVSLGRLKALTGAPAVRIMPNLPTAIGAGVSGLCADAEIHPPQKAAIEALMAKTGATLWVETEDQLDRLTAVSGSGPGYVLEIARAYVAAATDLGFSEADAFALVMDTLAGTVQLAKSSPLSLTELRDSVTSRGGTTAAGLEALNGDGELDRRLTSTLNAAYARAVELS